MNCLAAVRNLTIQYGKIIAVDHVSFEVNPGEILVMIGPNGSGKTSIVECLEGLRLPTSGSTEVFGRNLQTSRKEIYLELGVQLQDVAYPEKIKTEELCKLFSSFYRDPADYRILLDQLDLSSKKTRYVSALSGGEKQRLSILLALLPRPKLLILDELTTGLDPEIRRNMWESLIAIRDSGTGILLVSHYMDEVEILSDRIIFMINGKSIFTGNLQELRDYGSRKIDSSIWNPDLSLEEIYLALVPKKGYIITNKRTKELSK